MSTFSIENAKSGRAACKKCKNKVAKNELRIGHHTEVSGEDYSMTKWFHVGCFTLPLKIKREGVTEEVFVESMLVDDTVGKVLDDEEEVAKIVEKIRSKEGGSKKDGGGSSAARGGASGVISVIKSNFEAIDSETEDHEEVKRPKKKVKMEKSGSDVMSKEDRERAIAYGYYAGLNNDQLKDILRWNNQIVGGTKDVLLVRIIDGHLNGRIALCLTCGKGKLKLSEDGTSVSCNGYFNEDLNVRETCLAQMAVDKAPRFHPWYQNEPTEEEKELIKASLEAPVVAHGDDVKDAKSLLIKAVKKLKWDLSNPSGIKKAATDLLEACTSDDIIDLPEDKKKAKMGIGKLIVANKTMTATEILDLVIDQYGFKKVKEEAAKVKSETIGSVCKNQSNVGALEAMLELSGLYMKEGNFNASNTYKKVVEAIKALDFAITEDNAKGLGKGKTKVNGIGKGSAEKLYEFVTSGTIEKLEEKRAAAT